MKKNIIISIMMILVSWVAFAQIGIGTTSPDASSALEINSTDKGLLIPRLTTTERNAIVSPAVGLLVYDTDTMSLWSYNGAAWMDGTGGPGKFIEGGAPDIAYYEGRVGIGRSSFSTAHKLFVDGVKSTDGSNTAARINATYTGSGTSVSTYALANIASNTGTGTIGYAMGTRSTINNMAGGTISEGDATRSEIDNDGTMGSINGSTVSITNNGTIGTGIGNFTGITNAAGQQMTAAYLGYSSVINDGTITDVYGLYVDYFESGAGTVTNSYGLLIPANFNKGTADNFAVYSASDADSYFEGNVGFGIRAPERQVHVSEAMRLEPQDTAPTNGALGDLYVNTDGKLYFHDGNIWREVQLI